MSQRGDPPLAPLCRSLNGVIEQMEKFSSDLHDLSHKVEATHHTTSQELAMGARQRDKQLKGMSAIPLRQNGCGVPTGVGDTQKRGRSCSESGRGWEPRLAKPCLPWSLDISGSPLYQTVSWGCAEGDEHKRMQFFREYGVDRGGLPTSCCSWPCCCLSPVLQDRLSQQQRDMEEERSRLQEVIAKMEARLGEQTRLLEQVSPRCVLCPARLSGLGMGRMEVPGLEPVNGICFSSVSKPRSDGGQWRSSPKWNRCSTRWRNSSEL